MANYNDHLDAVTATIGGIGNEGKHTMDIGVIDGVIMSKFPDKKQPGFVTIHKLSTHEQKKGLDLITWTRIEVKIRHLMRKGILL